METKAPLPTAADTPAKATSPSPVAETPASPPPEFGGSGKAEPTRYGDWEINGKCVDF